MARYDAGERNDSITRRLERMGMEDVDTAHFEQAGTTVIEWRMPGDTPPELMPPTASMRQLRSVMQFERGDSFYKWEFRYPTIVFGDSDGIHFSEESRMKEEASERFQDVLDRAGAPAEAQPILRGGGGTGMIGWTPHLISRNTNMTPQEVLDFLQESFVQYQDEFGEDIL